MENQKIAIIGLGYVGLLWQRNEVSAPDDIRDVLDKVYSCDLFGKD